MRRSDAPIVVDDQVVIPKGADVYVRLSNAASAGRVSGKSELHMELIKIEYQGRSYPLMSSTYSLSGSSQGKSTAEKVGGGAALGRAHWRTGRWWKRRCHRSRRGRRGRRCISGRHWRKEGKDSVGDKAGLPVRTAGNRDGNAAGCGFAVEAKFAGRFRAGSEAFACRASFRPQNRLLRASRTREARCNIAEYS